MAFWICIGSVFNGLLDPFRTRIQWPPQALLDPFRIRIKWASRSVLDPYSMTFWICLDPYSMAFWIRFGPVFSGLLDLYWIRIQWPSGSVSDPYSVASWIRIRSVFNGLLDPEHFLIGIYSYIFQNAPFVIKLKNLRCNACVLNMRYYQSCLLF